MKAWEGMPANALFDVRIVRKILFSSSLGEHTTGSHVLAGLAATERIGAAQGPRWRDGRRSCEQLVDIVATASSGRLGGRRVPSSALPQRPWVKDPPIRRNRRNGKRRKRLKAIDGELTGTQRGARSTREKKGTSNRRHLNRPPHILRRKGSPASFRPIRLLAKGDHSTRDWGSPCASRECMWRLRLTQANAEVLSWRGDRVDKSCRNGRILEQRHRFGFESLLSVSGRQLRLIRQRLKVGRVRADGRRE